MTGTEVALIITASGTLLTAMGQLYNVWNIRRVERNTNSIKDALVASTARASHAEGLAEGMSARAISGEVKK
jgi:hypothetical protein